MASSLNFSGEAKDKAAFFDGYRDLVEGLRKLGISGIKTPVIEEDHRTFVSACMRLSTVPHEFVLVADEDTLDVKWAWRENDGKLYDVGSHGLEPLDTKHWLVGTDMLTLVTRLVQVADNAAHRWAQTDPDKSSEAWHRHLNLYQAWVQLAKAREVK